MTDIGWRFPPLSGGTRQGYTNNDIEAFRGQNEIGSLTREICQNSLDARLEGRGPVKVVFELRHIPKDKYKNVFSEYRKCLDGCDDYWKNEMDKKLELFVNNAKRELEKDSIPVLIASDYNTTGLSGSRDDRKSSPWEALTSSVGVSSKSEVDSAGSFGIGKGAPFACSALSMVFYNTLDEDNESAFVGVARLATLLIDDKATQGIGKYQNRDEDGKPIYRDDEDQFRDCFARNSRGTDVIIVGFTHPSDWMESVEKAVLKNFFVAIREGMLVVELKEGSDTKTIGSDELDGLLDALSGDREMIPTLQLYKAFTEATPEKLNVLEPDDVDVYVKIDGSYKKNIRNFRAPGMDVGRFPTPRGSQHYAVVVMVRGRELGQLLKDVEPPQHDKWQPKRIEKSDKEKSDRAADAIKRIRNAVLELLNSQYMANTEDMVDAAGVAEYFPDNVPDTDGVGEQSPGDDMLRTKIKIVKINKKSIRQGTATQPGIKQEGTEQDGGGIHNRTSNPNLPAGLRPPVLVVPGPEGASRREGVGRGDGTKTIETAYLARQRAFPLSVSNGLYKIVIVPEKDYEKLYVECYACGEQGQPEKLSMESFVCDNRRMQISDGKAGPIKVEAGRQKEFIVTFTQKEKMQLSLQLTGDVKK